MKANNDYFTSERLQITTKEFGYNVTKGSTRGQDLPNHNESDSYIQTDQFLLSHIPLHGKRGTFHKMGVSHWEVGDLGNFPKEKVTSVNRAEERLQK